MSPDAGDPPEVICVGAATVDRTYELTNLPEPDGGAFAHSVSEAFGGVGANVATGLARLGRDAGLLGRLGDDDLGDRVQADLEAGPVDTSLVRRKPGTTTHCLIPRGPTGERMIITAGESTRKLRLDEDDRAALRRADAVFATAYVPDQVTAALVDLAQEPEGPAFAFDLSGPLAELEDRGTEPGTIDQAVEVADLLVVGEVAAESYLDCSADEATAVLRARGCTRGAVTFGDAGATLFDDAGVTRVDAFEVAVTDTTGAGDAFVAGLIDNWLLGGRDAETAGRFAAAAAALNCQAAGARGTLADAERVRQFIRDRDG